VLWLIKVNTQAGIWEDVLLPALEGEHREFLRTTGDERFGEHFEETEASARQFSFS
jgi:hypothetical protein